ncbi:FixG Ig-like domain-containing protein [Aneurinibacillus tyrosinisolvens]|uniref:FixG Ig-like domain-containing protein n=1 Tax=Aneurinibacillus tyrosinisolvens TaxID=1443435 RepID=UPI000A43E010|nr:FixG Ig-like domain-containing protein [Aneurinibacillus tyrosinisolvens]
MALSGKRSTNGGFKNMVRGSGLVLTVIMVLLVSMFTFALSANTGFAISLGKNLQNIPVQNRIVYTYDLKIENLTGKAASYSVSYNGVPDAWETKLPKQVEVKPHAMENVPLLFRTDEKSLNTNTTITVLIKNDSGKTMERQFSIFPVRK